MVCWDRKRVAAIRWRLKGGHGSLIDKSGVVVEVSGSGAVELSQIFEVYIGITHVQNEYTCT